jgi:hypothetical protein
MSHENGKPGSGQTPVRIAEDRASKILERAAALDAKRNSEIELDQLREAARDAGISADAFEEALREQSGEVGSGRRGSNSGVTLRFAPLPPPAAEVQHYAALLRDVLGDGQISVTDAIEWRDDDGISVAVDPRGGTVTAAVSAGDRLRSRLLGVILPALLPLVFFFALAFNDDEAFLAFIGGLVTVLAAVAGTLFVQRREKKRLHKEAERIRRQLQRLLAPDPGER